MKVDALNGAGAAVQIEGALHIFAEIIFTEREGKIWIGGGRTIFKGLAFDGRRALAGAAIDADKAIITVVVVVAITFIVVDLALTLLAALAMGAIFVGRTVFNVLIGCRQADHILTALALRAVLIAETVGSRISA